MKAGYLSEYFAGVAIKSLSAVEADPARSNQHEFNGVHDLIRLFGRAKEKQVFSARFIYLDDAAEPVTEDASVTWYDARANHPTRTEHRLYFPTTAVSRRAVAGDLMVLGKRQDGQLLVVVAPGESTVANQLRWLFGVQEVLLPGFAVREEPETERDRLEFASTFILEQIGIVVATTEEQYLEQMLESFGGGFPATRKFSAYARSTLAEVDAREDADEALLKWMEREEILFRTLERYLLTERLAVGFAGNCEAFLQFSLSVQNRRKSRVGLALENHVEEIFGVYGLRYERAAMTEGKAKPDFLFPGAAAYRDMEFDAGRLTMLGVKSTCKDRWRQVLAEARRIETKSLLTLETAISKDQTREMRENRVQLVVPRKLHATYSAGQAAELMNLAEFIGVVRDRAV